jgi:hypothetical protein
VEFPARCGHRQRNYKGPFSFLFALDCEKSFRAISKWAGRKIILLAAMTPRRFPPPWSLNGFSIYVAVGIAVGAGPLLAAVTREAEEDWGR